MDNDHIPSDCHTLSRRQPKAKNPKLSYYTTVNLEEHHYTLPIYASLTGRRLQPYTWLSSYSEDESGNEKSVLQMTHC